MQDSRQLSPGSVWRPTRMKGVLILIAGLLLSVPGCSSQSSGKFKPVNRAVANGSLTLDGQPVNIGSVVFTHKETGMPCICVVENGSYKSPADKGPQIGVNNVVLSAKGEDGKVLWTSAAPEEVAVDDAKFTKDFALTKQQVKMAATDKVKKKTSSDKVWPGDE